MYQSMRSIFSIGSKNTDPSVPVEINAGTLLSGKPLRLKMKRGLTGQSWMYVALLSRVKYAEVNKTGRSIYMVGENTPVVKLDLSTEKQQSISSNPYHPLGFCIDKNEGVWIHDSNLNKLIKLDSLLNREAEWDSNSIEISNKSSTLASSQDGSKVYWYKGENECIVFNVDTRQEIETFDYFIENQSTSVHKGPKRPIKTYNYYFAHVKMEELQ